MERYADGAGDDCDARWGAVCTLLRDAKNTILLHVALELLMMGNDWVRRTISLSA